jgi:PelA/Pel-15E family pectate lyase
VYEEENCQAGEKLKPRSPEWNGQFVTVVFVTQFFDCESELMNRTAVLMMGMMLCWLAATDFMARPAASSVTSVAITIRWQQCLNQKPEWYASDEAARVADNLLLYQRDTGGWFKNIDMASVLTEAQKAALRGEKQKTDSTIDNGATVTQIIYLAKVYSARPLKRHKEAFVKGLDYLLKAQYGNGGWPQYYPDLTGYYRHITFNDNAMIGVMKVLRDIAARKPDYRFVDAGRRRKAAQAVAKGIECILKTQVVVQGRRTVWCAQHDEVTLAPAAARTYELASLSGSESVGIVRFLMESQQPEARLIEAIESAVRWFESARLSGIKWIEKADASKLKGYDRVVVEDASAKPLWARFYEIGTNRPIFVGRDGILKYDVAEIEDERRNNYQWYVNTPAILLDEDYPAWQKKRAGR